MPNEKSLEEAIADALDADTGEGAWDEGLSEAEKAEAVKFLYSRPNALNDFRSPEGEFTNHDRLKVLIGTTQLSLPDSDQNKEELHRLYDVVADHQRLLLLARTLRESLSSSVTKLEGAGGLLNAGKVREELTLGLILVNAEMSRLYLDEI